MAFYKPAGKRQAPEFNASVISMMSRKTVELGPKGYVVHPRHCVKTSIFSELERIDSSIW